MTGSAMLVLVLQLPRTRIVPGNHEARGHMKTIFGGESFASPGRCNFAAECDGWKLLGLDTHDTDATEGWDGDPTTLHGYDGGSGVIEPAQYKWLAAVRARARQAAAAACGPQKRVAKVRWCTLEFECLAVPPLS